MLNDHLHSRVIHEKDFFMLKAIAEWAESTGNPASANILRDICARAVKLEDSLEHRIFPVAPRSR